MNRNIRVQVATSNDPECEAALKLADLNRATLGFLPSEAFRVSLALLAWTIQLRSASRFGGSPITEFSARARPCDPRMGSAPPACLTTDARTEY